MSGHGSGMVKEDHSGVKKDITWSSADQYEFPKKVNIFNPVLTQLRIQEIVNGRKIVSGFPGNLY